MRKIIAAEFMTIDGVIQNEEADGDGFKYGGCFFSLCGRGDGGRGAGAAGEADGSAVGTQDLRRMGNVLADAFEVPASCDDRDEVCSI